MKLFPSIFTAILAALVVEHASGSMEKTVKRFNDIQRDRLKRRVEFAQRRTEHVAKRQSSPYLTNKTEPFAVDGTNFPDVPFDIGESYAGLIPVDDTGKELFFWFWPSSNPDANEEITIWLNGGPGCSSMDGFLKENGPFTWLSGTYQPVPNQYSWTNLTNMVWIDQPVGTGYDQGTPNATNELDVADQFLAFWKNFMDVFDLTGRKVYVTGESYAGQYIPYIADAMLQQNDTTYYDMNGIIIIDPSIGPDIVTSEVPTLAFVERNHVAMPFNDTFMGQLRNISAECGYDDVMKAGLTFPPNGPILVPSEITEECEIFYLVFNEIFYLNPCFNIYQVTQLCPIQWDVLGFPYSDFYLPPGYPNPYFNMTAVKQALHVPTNTSWEICSDDPVFVGRGGDGSPPSGVNDGPLMRVIEATNNVIVGHGLLDMVLISNGTLITLNNLTWNGQQGFSSPPTTDFFVPYHELGAPESWAGAGVMGRFVTQRGLTYVEVDLSGHMIPMNAPSAAYRQLEFLLGRIAGLDDTSPFSTQPESAQPNSTAISGVQAEVSVEKSNLDSQPLAFHGPLGRYAPKKRAPGYRNGDIDY